MLSFKSFNFLILFVLFVSFTTFAQTNYHLYGIVSDSITGEVIIGAVVQDLTTKIATTTNNYGYYSLFLVNPNTTIHISSIGYASCNVPIECKTLQQHNIKLVTQVNELAEATVVGTNVGAISTVTLGKLTLNKVTIERLPVFMGEADAMKALQTLPGVSGAKEGSSEIVVRGGGADQNLTLLDGAPVYNLNHALGLLSLFNTEIIKDVSLYKGGVPARYGGRASSVVDVVGREGDDKRWKGTASLSTIAMGATLEGPIVKEKISLIVSARRSWPDLLATGALKLFGDFGFGARFFDINTKLNYQINNKQRLFLSYYSGSDKNYIYSKAEGTETEYQLGWGNQIGSLRWNAIFGNALFLQTTAYVSAYKDNEMMLSFDRTTSQDSKFTDGGLNSQLSLLISQNQTMKVGVELGKKWFMPYQYNETSALTNERVSANSQSQFGGALFAEHETSLDNLTINVGLRYDFIQSKNINTNALEPRLSANYRLTPKLTLKGGVMKSIQAIHALRKSTNGNPIYTWIPATNNIPPMFVWQYSAGGHYIINSYLTTDLEGYYKDITNVVAGYEVAASNYAEVNYDQLLHVGTGKAYGLEALLEGHYGRSIFTSSYTLSKAENCFSAYNNGNPITADYDVRHNWVNTYSYNLVSTLKKLRCFSLLFSLNSGYPLTLPAQQAQLAPLALHAFYFNNYQYINAPNNARMPCYHRLDLNYQTTHRFKRGFRTWTFGVLNVYNRQNTYLVVRDENSQYKKVTAFPLMPYFSYKTEF